MYIVLKWASYAYADEHHARAGYWERDVVYDGKTLSGIELCEYNFLFAISLKRKRTVMNEMDERTPESLECKRQFRLQKQHEQRRARLASETKEEGERRLQLRHEARRKCREQSLWAEQTSQEAQKRLKAERTARCQQTSVSN